MSKDLFLALKVQVDCALAHLGAEGYIVYGGTMKAPIEELLPGRIEDIPASLGLFSGSAFGSAQLRLPSSTRPNSQSFTDSQSLYRNCDGMSSLTGKTGSGCARRVGGVLSGKVLDSGGEKWYTLD
jgi:hypothetical protein